MDAEILETKVHPSDGAETSGFAFAQLDQKARRDSERSLSTAAFLYAAAYFAAYFGGWLVAAITQPFTPPIESVVIATVCIVASVGLGIVARRGGLPPVRFSAIAEAYCVLSSFGIEAATWNWREMFEHRFFFVGISWIGVWVVAFPNLVTLCPQSVLRAGILSALCLPAACLLSIWHQGWPVLDGSPRPELVWVALVQMTVPLLVAAGMSTFMSVRVFRLARDASRARSLGNYQLVELLGRGGMGEVWRAKHRLLVRPAAVKIISARSAAGSPESSGATMLRRFEREAQATAGLTSPHTVSIYDFGINDDGVFYYVMELLEGMDLRTLVEKTGPVPSARAIRFLRHACGSLADAHRSGLIHRDVKPANLFACRRGLQYDFVKVLDFGLVKSGGEAAPSTQLTAEGITSGTPAFMAPEMALGGRDIDGRADLYALGCVGYWLVTGRLVFEGPTGVSILVQHAKEPPVPPSRRTELDVDPDFERVLLELLAKDPAQRPASAQELHERLAAIERRIEPWTQERAERWWQAHLPHLVLPGAPVVARSSAIPAAVGP